MPRFVPFVLALGGCELFTDGKVDDTGDPYGLQGGSSSGGGGDGTVDANGHIVYDTGNAWFFYAGDGITTADGEWVSGHFGNLWEGFHAGGSVCDVLGDWKKAGPSPGSCPDCAWAFTLTVDNTKASGPQCEDLAAIGATDGAWDGMTYGWAWADELPYPYRDGYIYLDKTILLFYGGSWSLFAFNYAGYDLVWGDSTNFSFEVGRDAYYAYYR